MRRSNVISLRQHYLDQVERFAPRGEASQPGCTVHPQDTYLVDAFHYRKELYFSQSHSIVALNKAAKLL